MNDDARHADHPAPVAARTVADHLCRDDDHPALVAPGGLTLTYARLHETVDLLARELCGVGVGPGDTVTLSVGNGPHTVACFLAVLAARASAAPLNPAYTEAEARFYLDDLRPRVMIVEPGVRSGALDACAAMGVPVLEVSTREAGLSFGRAPAADNPSGRSQPDDVALVLHTSGTTSRPKVVPLRQRNVAASISGIVAAYRLAPEDVSHCVMPLFHVHGLVASALSTLASGGTVVTPPRFSASAFWADTLAHGATWFSAVPTIHQVLALRADDAPIPADHRLRFARSCSAALSPILQDRVEGLLDAPVLQAYGMTEASHQMASNPLPPGDRRHASVGRATGIEIAVFDEEWQALGPETPGEVSIRGASVVEGYRDNPVANASSFRDGWFRTGDVGRLSADGYLTLDGRIKELINRGGEKISPFEVEEALLAHPGVREAVAYAAPDDKYGEVVAAVVVTDGETGARDLTAHCAARLAAFKVPVSITAMDAIPKGPTGKVQRRLLADLVQR